MYGIVQQSGGAIKRGGNVYDLFTRRCQGRRSLKAIPRRLRLAGAGPFSSWKVTQPSALIAKMVHDTGYALLEASQDFEALRQWRFG